MPTNGLDMDGVAAAFRDVANGSNGTAPAKNEEARSLACEKRWAEPQVYDYDTYNATGKATGAVEIVKRDWSHNAEKYEWKEEYGDVGPPSEALEVQLFRSELINRQGLKFDKFLVAYAPNIIIANNFRLLSIKVVAEAEEKPKPISNVRPPPSLPLAQLTAEVPRCRSSSCYGQKYRSLRL
jgi:ATP-dependent RNA helicase DDX3X